jgi:hypothetical protein
MGDVVDLHGQPAQLENDFELIENLARYSEGLLSKEAVKKKHHFDAATWKQLGENDALVEAIEACKLRRIRTGITKRERAQIEILDGPPTLGKIVRDPDSNARHVIDAVKVLDTLASGGGEAATAGARFVIQINLGSDVDGKPIIEKYNKSIAINVDDTAPNDTDTTDVIAAKKNEDDDGQKYF